MKHTNHGVYSPLDCAACDLAAYQAIGTIEGIRSVIDGVEVVRETGHHCERGYCTIPAKECNSLLIALDTLKD